ncbi:MAG: flavodoxin domain-containing protein [Bacilli bacterium]|nr:flavodoxin domain-containing protein [Bacilli bacterium]
MKQLIIYDTKTGVTEECAKNIEKMLKGDPKTVNIKENNSININDYDKIIIGSAIYASSISKKIKNWYIKNEAILLTKKVYFYICGIGNEEEALGYLNQALTPKLKDHIKIKQFLGGELRPDRVNFLFRFLIKQILKNKVIDFKIDQNKLKQFVNDINKEV